MKGTKINYKGLDYNQDGDRPVDLSSVPKVTSEKQLRKVLRNKEFMYMVMGEDKLYGVNKLTYKRKHFLLMEPNPVTFYFSLAFDSLDQLENARALLSEVLLDSPPSAKAAPFSLVFRVASVGVIFSFFAIEAFMNQMLPDYALINYDGKLVEKDTIQRWVPFDDKISRIIPDLCKKDFETRHPRKMPIIWKLKKLRDELSHLKEKRTNGFTSYDNVYQDILEVNLKSIVSTVKSFINFYQPGLIQNYRNKTLIK
ncbi:hypothetical protein ABIE26_003248 [Pedobacter africanus]|uniref:Uncharacterized protein n=1 Tax=Pedobacter africanus TaxID=151894 RepID=A0ACC6KZA7_9SPHI|nr:hypothetical protein [Pedobacter africanus]MDR6784602.1 hypothetical protein [Pedobacter africanus]